MEVITEKKQYFYMKENNFNQKSISFYRINLYKHNRDHIPIIFYFNYHITICFVTYFLNNLQKNIMENRARKDVDIKTDDDISLSQNINANILKKNWQEAKD